MNKIYSIIGFLLIIQWCQCSVIPGGLQTSISVKSVNHIVSTLIPVISYYLLDNKTMELGIDKKGTGYEIKVDDIHIISVDGWKTKEVEFLPDSNTVRMLFSGINIQAQIDGEIKALWVIKLDLAQLNVTNLTFQIDIAIDSLDELNWKFIESNLIDFSDLNISTDNSYFNYLLNLIHDEIVNIVKADLSKAEQYIDTLFDNFNTEMANRNDTTFIIDLDDSGTGINLTTTQPPQMDSSTGLIDINFNGLFYDQKEKTTHIKQENTIWSPRYKRSHSEQFFIHETLLNSFFLSYFEGKIDLDINNDNLTSKLLGMIPEIEQKYGKDAQYELVGELMSTNEKTFTFSIDEGIVIGPDVLFQLFIYVNDDSGKQLAVQFNNYITLVASITLQDFVLDVNIPRIGVENTQIIVDNVGLWDREYNNLFKDLYQMLVNVLNFELEDGLDLKDKYPTLSFVNNMFANSTLTPFQLDQFYYAGFKFFTDIPSNIMSLDEQKQIFQID